ncbi:hypothetical protein KPH14_009197 [Odynerus spinipes]|uniref:DUF4485 domain-containing protein n=1 Tax=Odynerus spinipes TaxID=1348599 RepID=A0AAD9RNV0_9HYME|nr:hypothetical protein KPH14_009197 [Odynerus spinipes]
MDDDIASLNYDCNYNLFLAKHLVTDMKRFSDRQNAVKWLRLLMDANNDIAEMRLRNDFMHYLVLNLQESHLRPPFDEPPPKIGRLAEIAGLIPGKSVTDSVNFADLYDPAEEKSMIMSLSPDDGAFLASQPVPHHGSFCYLAISTKKRST